MYKTIINNKQGKKIEVTVTPIESEYDFHNKQIKDARAYCFCDDKFVIVWSKDHWNTPGGALEKDETPKDAVIREVLEETNMEVIKQCFIFIQSYLFVENLESDYKPAHQTVSVCIVKSKGDFQSDPDGDITEIKLIDPKDYKQYLDWGERGDILMQRALDVKKQIDLEINYTI
jgi:ADP-ribose pyrophosphatase YjhB (NUDIX family)